MTTLTKTWPTKPADAVTLFNKFVVAYDFSPLADAALHFAFDLAQGQSSEVVIVHALNLEDNAAVCKRSEDAVHGTSCETGKSLDEIAAASRQLGINTKRLQRTGEAAQVLTQVVEKIRPDLIVLGAYGNHRLDRKVLGSTAEVLLRTLPCPVAVIGPKAKRTEWQPRQARKIVCPIDFPTDVDERLRIIARFAKAPAADMELVHAVDVCHEYSRPYAAADTQFQFELLVERLRQQGVAAASSLLFGSPELVISEHAQAIRAHSIMFALHHDHGLSSYFRNSLVARVIEPAPCRSSRSPRQSAQTTFREWRKISARYQSILVADNTTWRSRGDRERHHRHPAWNDERNFSYVTCGDLHDPWAHLLRIPLVLSSFAYSSFWQLCSSRGVRPTGTRHQESGPRRPRTMWIAAGRGPLQCNCQPHLPALHTAK